MKQPIETPGQGKRPDQYRYPAIVFAWFICIYGVLALGALLWNLFTL